MSHQQEIAPDNRPETDPKTIRKVTIASLMGTMLEFYDHFIFGTASAIVFPVVFFSNLPDSVALLLSLVTYGVAFVARPLGAIIFGHFGDRIGRKGTLVMSMAIMGGATFLIGCLPSHAMIGVTAAVLLALLRLTQGIAIGGEWGGAALMVNEYAKGTGKRGFLGAMVQVASPLGFLLASLIFAVLRGVVSEEQFLSWGWRIPFLLSAVLVIIGLWIRRSIDESPEFVAKMEEEEAKEKEARVPIVEVFRNHSRNLFLAIGTRFGSDTAFYVFAMFALIYLPHIGVDKQIALYVQIAASIGQAVGVPIFGRLVDRTSTRSVLMGGGVACTVYVFVFIFLLDIKVAPVAIAAGFFGLFLLAALWAPLASHMPAMFPVEVRYTGAGLGFQAAGIIGGAVAPTIALLLLQSTGTGFAVAGYLAVTLLIGIACVKATRLYDDDRSEIEAGK